MRISHQQFWIVLAFLILLGCGSKSDSPATTGSIISISVTPNIGNITSSTSTQQFTAVARDFNGQIVSGVLFTWSDSGPNSCIDQTGLAKPSPVAVSGSTDTIFAQSGSVSGSASLTINLSSGPPPPPGNCP